MTVPLSPEHTWLILEAGRKLEERERDNFYDYVAGKLSEHLDPSTDDVEHAISAACKALRLSEAQ